MMSAETCDEMEELAQKMSPILTKHANDITLNKKLFERIKFVHDHPNRELNAEEKMLLDTSYDGFVRSGALLDEEGKEKLRKLTEEASMLTLQFSQNLLKENKAYTLHITDKAQLDGLPETAIAAAAHNAKEKNEEGWIFTLDYPSYSPFHDLLCPARTPQADVHGDEIRSVPTTTSRTTCKSVSDWSTCAESWHSFWASRPMPTTYSVIVWQATQRMCISS